MSSRLTRLRIQRTQQLNQISTHSYQTMNRPRNRNRNRNNNNNNNNNTNRNQNQTNHRQPNKPYPTTVPTTAQVTPGANVSIILKKDQPTGHETPGTVQDLLTRGNHPRGIKVRLTDGQIGRVQRMLESHSISTSTSTPLNTSQFQFQIQPQSRVETQTQNQSRNLDVRLDPNVADQFPSRIDSVPYRILPSRKNNKYKGAVNQRPSGSEAEADAEAERESTNDQVFRGRYPDLGTASVKCPICGTFEGDEVAVSYHVERDHAT